MAPRTRYRFCLALVFAAVLPLACCVQQTATHSRNSIAELLQERLAVVESMLQRNGKLQARGGEEQARSSRLDRMIAEVVQEEQQRSQQPREAEGLPFERQRVDYSPHFHARLARGERFITGEFVQVRQYQTRLHHNYESRLLVCLTNSSLLVLDYSLAKLWSARLDVLPRYLRNLRGKDVTDKKDSVHFLVADESGSYQEVFFSFEAALKNSTAGYMEKRLELKNATLGPLRRLGSLLNAGMATDLAIQAYSQGRVKVVLADDSGKAHLFEDGQSKHSLQVSDLPILSLLSHQFGAYVYVKADGYGSFKLDKPDALVDCSAQLRSPIRQGYIWNRLLVLESDDQLALVPVATLGKACASNLTLLDKAAVGAAQPGMVFGPPAAQGAQLTAVSSKKLVTLALQEGKAPLDRRVTSSSESVAAALRKFTRRPRDWRVVGSVVGSKEVLLVLEHKQSRVSQLVLFRSKPRASRVETASSTGSVADILTNPLFAAMAAGLLIVLFKSCTSLGAGKKKQPPGSRFEAPKMGMREEREAKMWGQRAAERAPSRLHEDED